LRQTNFPPKANRFLYSPLSAQFTLRLAAAVREITMHRLHIGDDRNVIETMFPLNEQAKIFNDKAGLSEAVARQVAEAVLDHGGMRDRDRIFEIGVGTGKIGRWLTNSTWNYMGIDTSEDMLTTFRTRIESPSSNTALICQDANDPWPLETGSARVVFGSRVFHLLDPTHVTGEMLRVAHPEGATFLMGTLKRKKDTIKSLFRKKMRELLTQHGLEHRPNEKRRRDLLELLQAHGGRSMEPIRAATWKIELRPIDAIISWREKDTIKTIMPSPEVKEKVIAELTQWAEQQFGDLEQFISMEQQFMLEGIRFSN
jgi:ubiquinone/menaquinone biosynthesis C-methylase UbiE